MHYKKIFWFLFVFFMFQFSWSQNNDEDMVKIVKERKTYNQTIREEFFRIQIFVGLNEAQARGSQSKFIRLYTDTPAYLTYSQPEWKVQVGNYKTKLEAHKMLTKIRKEFPGALIPKMTFKK